MKEVVEILAKALVDQPDKVCVNMIEKDKSCLIELKVAPEDMGKVIGKQGRIARAIRTVAKAAAARQRKKVTVEIV
ncbi:KH domain-containing protein [Desulfofundulus salinus]|uniref:RNA-binding protein KhpA n=1 Tax=Desulfofundulus salinus TaxID=2419843 RepID=A0A494WTB5_9FIRM|nr:KH domain-containing protein [Desulfofundulus salinum]RKO66619.1 KH domain-containing protein [Desulfofundulus salinum]